MSDADEALPLLVRCPTSFAQRVPTQRVIDLLARLEPGHNFGELAGQMPFRLVAFRQLLRDFPDRDPTSLWLHSYDVEVEVQEADPTNGKLPTSLLLSAGTGDASP